MFKHLIHSHLEFQLLMLGLGMMLTFLVLYGWFEVPPINSATGNLVKSVFEKENESPR